jgi:hypothetical protein
MANALVISDRLKATVVAEMRSDGGVLLRQGPRFMQLTRAEVDRLWNFVVQGNGQLQVHQTPDSA